MKNSGKTSKSADKYVRHLMRHRLPMQGNVAYTRPTHKQLFCSVRICSTITANQVPGSFCQPIGIVE